MNRVLNLYACLANANMKNTLNLTGDKMKVAMLGSVFHSYYCAEVLELIAPTRVNRPIEIFG